MAKSSSETFPLPVITDDWLATRLDESKLTPAQRSYLSTSDELIGELQAADTVVIGAPMYNFSIPSIVVDPIFWTRKQVFLR
jgi:FMN-dependent NADH-azoreductase